MSNTAQTAHGITPNATPPASTSRGGSYSYSQTPNGAGQWVLGPPQTGGGGGGGGGAGGGTPGNGTLTSATNGWLSSPNTIIGKLQVGVAAVVLIGACLALIPLIGEGVAVGAIIMSMLPWLGLLLGGEVLLGALGSLKKQAEDWGTAHGISAQAIDWALVLGAGGVIYLVVRRKQAPVTIIEQGGRVRTNPRRRRMRRAGRSKA